MEGVCFCATFPDPENRRGFEDPRRSFATLAGYENDFHGDLLCLIFSGHFTRAMKICERHASKPSRKNAGRRECGSTKPARQRFVDRASRAFGPGWATGAKRRNDIGKGGASPSAPLLWQRGCRGRHPFMDCAYVRIRDAADPLTTRDRRCRVWLGRCTESGVNSLRNSALNKSGIAKPVPEGSESFCFLLYKLQFPIHVRDKSHTDDEKKDSCGR